MPNGHHILTARANVGVGLTFLIIGQSNARGQNEAFQQYSHPSLRAVVQRQDIAWREANDPYLDAFEPANGTPWPHTATLLMAALGVPVSFIYCPVGGTGLAPPTPAEWSPGGVQYLNTVRQVLASGVPEIPLILWHQGEQDANAGVPETTYRDAELAMLLGLRADVPALANARLVSALIGQYASGPTRAQMNAIRLAKLQNWDTAGPDILAGPSIIDFNLLAGGRDGLHVKDPVLAQRLSERWARMLLYHLGATSEGRGPRVSSVMRGSNTVAVTFTGGAGALQNGTVTTGFRVEDAAGVRGLLSPCSIVGSTVTLTTDQVLVDPVLVSFGSFGDAAFDLTIRDSGTYYLPPEPFVDWVAV